MPCGTPLKKESCGGGRYGLLAAQGQKKLGIGPGSVIEWHEQDGTVVVRRAGRFSSSDINQALFPNGTPNAEQISDVKGAWISNLVLAETLWVLDSVYELSRTQIATAVDMLLNHQELTLQDAEVVASALRHYRSRPAIEFSDCMVLEIARKAGHLPVGTFDRHFAKLADVQRLR